MELVHNPIIELAANTASVLISVDTTVDEYVWTRAPFETPKKYYKPAASTSTSSRFTPIISSTSAISLSAALADAFKSS